MKPTKWIIKDQLKQGKMTLEQFEYCMKRYYDFEVDLEKVKVSVKEKFFRTKVNEVEYMKLPKGYRIIKE